MNLIRRLYQLNPRWREEISRDPVEAGIELGLLDPDEMEAEAMELDFRETALQDEAEEQEELRSYQDLLDNLPEYDDDDEEKPLY